VVSWLQKEEVAQQPPLFLRLNLVPEYQLLESHFREIF